MNLPAAKCGRRSIGPRPTCTTPTAGGVGAAMLVALVLVATPARAQRPDTVFLEDLTWTEVRAAIDSGTTTIIVPTAGTEQNGPHMVLGKHKYIVTWAADRIARELGNALVAPVVPREPDEDHPIHRGAAIC